MATGLDRFRHVHDTRHTRTPHGLTSVPARHPREPVHLLAADVGHRARVKCRTRAPLLLLLLLLLTCTRHVCHIGSDRTAVRATCSSPSSTRPAVVAWERFSTEDAFRRASVTPASSSDFFVGFPDLFSTFEPVLLSLITRGWGKKYRPLFGTEKALRENPSAFYNLFVLLFSIGVTMLLSLTGHFDRFHQSRLSIFSGLR